MYFGTYEQDNNTSNGKEEIEWIVLDKTQKSMLLISKYALEFMPYNETYAGNTWENSSMRNWLNDTFLSAAFSGGEQNRIKATSLEDGCIDKVFLLSDEEAYKYFNSPESRQCVPTNYAMAKGAYSAGDSAEGEAARWWWLRSPGAASFRVAGVFSHGLIHHSGWPVRDKNCVRPALWINLEP